MKAIQISEFGGPEVLRLVEIDEPIPSENEVRVRLYAAGVNPNETYVRTGTYSFYVPELPCTLGFDGAGVVDALGENVNHLRIGDRVFVAALLARHNTGTYAEKVVCDANSVYKLHESVSFQEGASLGIPALAAYRGLFHRAKIKPGETVLIHGASGGVGIFAVQMASSIGANVIGTANTDVGKGLVLAAGAKYAINHLTENTVCEILALTNNKGPDVIFESLANINLVTDLRVIAKYGRIVIVGNRGSLKFEPRLAMIKEADILGMALVNAPDHEYKESLYAIEGFLKSGILRPQIGTVFKLKDARDAHEQIISKNAMGKIILSIK
ncbi:NADPH:quinone reductase [Clostridium sp. E02]|uniref:NADPH:quinone reductase n=1 Tax=Clostridium sp. E02 TaxID=2487134 RepID=UPI000F523F82|nr:NADPH:quinone reductase [Clostridium sp. E02]